MPDLQRERQNLAKAETDVVQGELRVSQQEALIAELERDGHNTAAARALLTTLRATLAEWRKHRANLVRLVDDGEHNGADA